MKKSKLFFTVSFSLLMVSALFAQGMYSGDVLFVGDMWGADSAIVAYLEYLGFDVTQGLDTEVDATWAEGKKFVYISSTSSSGDVSGKFKDVEVPVLMIEGWATDDMGMAPDQGDAFNGTQDRDIMILEEDHFLAAGLIGTIKIVDDSTLSAHHSTPDADDAIVIAEYVFKEGDVNYNYGAIFAYEQGATLYDGTTAAGRRYFACWQDNGFLHLTGDGYKLWLAAINWAMGFDTNSPYTGDVLFVYAGAFASDSAIVHQLTYMGFNVTEVTDADATASDADGKKFVYISSSTNSGTVDGKFKDVTIPVLLMEGKATDEMGMTLPNPGSDPVYQSTTDVPIRPIEIYEEDHYLAAGLTGVIKWSADSTLYSHEMVPGGDALVIAEYIREEGDVGRIYGAMFAYEKGDELADGTTAAGRRYFAIWYDNGYINFTGDGFKLWLASINWAMGFDTPTGVEQTPGTMPVVFELNQNYPNPFNPSTLISFSIPSRAHVQLDIYNINGQKVAALKNEKMEPGKYSVRFEANGLASGIYFYKLRVDSRTVTKKMTLMR